MANWYVRSGAGGTASGADWTNAKLTLAAALTASAAGDSVWVANDHAETQASAMNPVAPGTAASPVFIYCVDRTGSVPPVSADLRTTATVTTTGANSIQFNGSLYCYGITFSAGSSSSTGSINLIFGTAPVVQTFEACALRLGGTSSSSLMTATALDGSFLTLKNTTFQFGAAGQSFKWNCKGVWKNTASALTGATFPNTLFSDSTTAFTVEGVDLSALTSTICGASGSTNNKGALLLKDCKLNASVTISGTPNGPGSNGPDYFRCGSSGNYLSGRFRYQGTQSTEIVIIRTGGASDGTTGVSHKVVTTANSKWAFPFDALPIAIWNDVTGSNVTVTVEGLQDPRTSTSLPNNDDIWFEVEYLGASGNPQGTFNTGTKANNLASNAALTASTQAWDSLVTARANSTAYSLGDARKTATNAGRVFVCTTAGTSAGSEPGGYASAVDGGAVTDGTATFTAAVRFKQAITLSSPQPAQKGALYVYPKVAKASATFYVDPLIALS